MNDKYIKEYEEMNWYDLADELVEPLSTIKQDLAKTIYIHYAKERDKNEQLQNNWNELKQWLENHWQESQDIWFVKIIGKMQELEQGKDD